MKRVIDFDVSIGGQPAIIMRIEYESHYSSVEEIRCTPYPDVSDVMGEAIKALEKEIGHKDFDVAYWDWIE